MFRLHFFLVHIRMYNHRLLILYFQTKFRVSTRLPITIYNYEYIEKGWFYPFISFYWCVLDPLSFRWFPFSGSLRGSTTIFLQGFTVEGSPIFRSSSLGCPVSWGFLCHGSLLVLTS